MHPMVLVFALLMLVGFYTVDHFETSRANAEVAVIDVASGRLKAYGTMLQRFRDANPTFTGTATPSAAGLPSWFARDRLGHVITSGTVYAWLHADGDAQAFAIARQCEKGLTCGVAVGNRLRIPGQPTSSPLPLPAGVPAGAVVIVL